MVKGILKRYSRPATLRPENNPYTPDEEVDSPKKRVSFDGPELVKVFEADEWDRSPAQITLKLTYKDVAELKELNISLVRPGPLAMERTKSNRPTSRSAAPQSPPSNLTIKSNPGTLQSQSATVYTPVPRPSSPHPRSPTLPPSSQISRNLSTHSLPTLLEDQLPPVAVSSTAVDDNNNTDEFEAVSPSLRRSPPGLSVRTPIVNGPTSPTPDPPSSLHMAPPSRPASSTPNPAAVPATPLYRPPHLRAKLAKSLLKPQDNTASALVSSVTRVPAAEKFDFEKLVMAPETFNNTITSPSLKASELIDLEGKADSVSLVLNRDSDKNGLSSALSPTPVLSRRTSRSLMGWELKRSSNSQGKLGFGLVRKQQVPNDAPK